MSRWSAAIVTAAEVVEVVELTEGQVVLQQPKRLLLLEAELESDIAEEVLEAVEFCLALQLVKQLFVFEVV